jgi:diacylglycerol kinase (ATP)
MTAARPRISLVVNPASNKGAARAVGAAVATRLARSAEVSLLSGSSQSETLELLARAGANADAVLVCGGDGTVHLAVNVLAESGVPLGIIPAGTGNDTATALGMSADPIQAADQLLAAVQAGSLRRIDLGRCDVRPLTATGDGRWWVSMLYAGFDSAVNERANAMAWPKGKRRYDLAIAAELLGMRSRELTLTLDDRVLQLPVTLVAIGNGPQYGGGKQMTPGATMDDGVFDVTVVGAISRLTLARLAPKLPTAGHIGHPAVAQFRATTVSLAAPSTTAYADGERMGPLPVRSTCVAGALSVLVPVGSSPAGLSSQAP